MVGETFTWTVRSYECAPDGKITIANICNYLQEAASINAEHLGFSKTNFDEENLNVTWVMTRMRVKVTRRPNWNEMVKVFTFPRPARRIVAWRDFIIYGEDGEEVGRASTEWMMIDFTTRRPVAIPAFVTERANHELSPVFSEPLGFKLSPDIFQKSDSPSLNTYRLSLNAYSITAAPSDIDLNGHVNNVRYITWLFDAIKKMPEAVDMELAFKGEVLVGTTVNIDIAEDESDLLLRISSTSDHVLAKISNQ